jgi:ABC-type multidrug transport system fused ATPase/permease subunit
VVVAAAVILAAAAAAAAAAAVVVVVVVVVSKGTMFKARQNLQGNYFRRMFRTPPPTRGLIHSFRNKINYRRI